MSRRDLDATLRLARWNRTMQLISAFFLATEQRKASHVIPKKLLPWWTTDSLSDWSSNSSVCLSFLSACCLSPDRVCARLSPSCYEAVIPLTVLSPYLQCASVMDCVSKLLPAVQLYDFLLRTSPWTTKSLGKQGHETTMTECISF